MVRPLATAMLSFLLIVLGCASSVRIPDGTPVSEDEARGAWADILRERVDEQGRVDFVGLSEQPQGLDRWVSYVAAVGPKTAPARYPSANDQLAYYIDAYNALAMYGVIHSGVLPAQKVRFFLLRKYPVGGANTSLYALENDVIRAFGEPRIHFALNCMSASCPRLPREPWQADVLDAQLEAAAIEFFASEQNVRVDPGTRTVHLSEILSFFTEDFVSEDTDLIAYVNRYRAADARIPSDYAIEFIPYDWSLNQQTS